MSSDQTEPAETPGRPRTERDEQLENAQTSLDEPSDGSGGE